jgi:hypothetical protein
MNKSSKINLDLTDIDPFDEYQPLPPGGYSVEVTNADVKTSNAGNAVLNVEFKVSEGQFEGRKVFDCFVINHPVGKKRLKTFLIAGQFPNPDKLSDLADLIGLKLRLRLSVEDEGFGVRNKVVRFFESETAGTLSPPTQGEAQPEQLKMPFD